MLMKSHDRRNRESEPPQTVPGEFYQLRVTIRGIEPLIWRRLRVRSDMSLAVLHEVLQAAMGWTDSHLHEFTIDGAVYGLPDPEIEYDDVIDERTAVLGRLVPGAGATFTYRYDFGDSWEHEVVVEEVLQNTGETTLAVCLDGEWRCPPEDCGGATGYRRFLWDRGRFDPAKFDLAAINRALRGVSRRRGRPRAGGGERGV